MCKTETPQFTKEMISKGKFKIMVQPGEVGWEYVKAEFRRAYAAGNVLQIPSNKTHEMLDMLVSGKYELAMADEVSCLQFLREPGRAGSFRLAFPERLQVFDSCVAVEKALAVNIEELNEVLRRVRNEADFLKKEMKALVGFEHIERCSLD